MKTENLYLRLDQLLVDPNNYRLDYESKKPVIHPDEKFESLQEETLKELGQENLEGLRQSILENGFVEMDRIIVRELNDQSSPQKYVVVEGNRRTAALKSLMTRYQSGKDIPDTLVDKTKRINVLCLYGSLEEIKAYSATIMGLRHVSGPKKWTGYQSARLISELHDNDAHSFPQIAALLGIETSEADIRYSAYKAYQQMGENSAYGKSIKRNHYTLLREFIEPNNYCRNEWLNWDNDSRQFKNTEHLELLYRRLTTSPNPKKSDINNLTHARKFMKHLEREDHRKLIKSGVHLEELPELDSNQEKILNRFINFLETEDWSGINTEIKGLLSAIRTKLNAIIKP